MDRKQKQKQKQKQKRKDPNDNESKDTEQNIEGNQQQQQQKRKSEDGKTEQQQQQQQQQKFTSNNNKRKRKDVFPFGNYRNYYGYRIGQEVDEDPRLKVFKREWFEGKDCLDIGCNSGIITIQIAKKFQCKSIIGIDIDKDRISDACWHLRKFVRAEQAGKNSSKAARLEVREKVNGPEDGGTASLVERKDMLEDGSTSGETDLLKVVSFKQENIVQSQHQSLKQYDTILCLSVTKWIHLNWGDDGLITLFSKIWRLLRPGGILVLEPQPWKSYEKNRRVSETTATNYRTIMFHPTSFDEILLDKIGFRRVEDITAGLSGTKAGFDRPLFAYYK